MIEDEQVHGLLPVTVSSVVLQLLRIISPL